MLLRRIVLLYIVLLLCRIVFYCYNYALIGPLGWQEVLTLAGGHTPCWFPEDKVRLPLFL